MTSARAKLTNLFLRTAVKPASTKRTSPATLRENVERRMPPVAGNGIAVELVTTPVVGAWHKRINQPVSSTGCGLAKSDDPADGVRESAPVILYLHGGGYFFGSSHTHRALTFELARRASAAVFSVDYRLAPEHPFPAALDDTLAAYDWLVAEQDVSPHRLRYRRR